MEKSSIKSFSVYGLFGTDDVCIPFDESIKILIGENGLGKTQILNIFYYTLTRDFLKLTEFPFERVELKLDGETIKITKEEVTECSQDIYTSPLAKEIVDLIGIDEFEKLKFLLKDMSASRCMYFIEKHPTYSKLRRIASLGDLIELFQGRRIFKKKTRRKNNNLSPNLSKCADKIEENFSNKIILYFPTFRRVEEDLHNLGYDEDQLNLSKENTPLIHFGMDDVQKRFNYIEKKIDLLLKEGFTKISSEILSKLVKGFGDTNQEILDKINETDIDIILARVGDQISETDKSRIRKIVLEKEISSADNSLFYFIQILIDIYEKQKEFDDSINKFKEICNNYLIGKQVFYDESDIKIYIKSDNSSEPLPLNKLSSGEKQIISIFSKIYLSEPDRRFIVLFDEPELSLSMLWQTKLLPDIINSNKCDFLLAVTHSPFIFDNELDRYAIGLNEYVKPRQKVAV